MALLRVSYESLLPLELRVSSHFFFFWFHVHAELIDPRDEGRRPIPPTPLHSLISGTPPRGQEHSRQTESYGGFNMEEWCNRQPW